MSQSRSQSRHGNFTTSIRRKAKPQPQPTSTQYSHTVGGNRVRGRVAVRPSSAHLTPSNSASPAPSSISNYSQDPGATSIQWDLPTAHPSETHPSSTTGRKRRTRVCLQHYFFPSPFPHLIHPLHQEKLMNSWIPMISSFLDEILRRDGPGTQSTDGPCNSCAQFSPLFRCSDCFSNELLCQSCIIGSHIQAPFHQIQVHLLCFPSPIFFNLSNSPLFLQQWNGYYFKKISLQALGLRIQLGHDGSSCPSPSLSNLMSTILHTNGIHSVYIDQCTCHEGHNVHITSQFLRLGLWPATVVKPRTAVTLQLLDFHHQLTLQSKVNLYDFYWSLSHLTSNTDNSLVLV